MVIPVIVYQEEGKEDTYSICHDSEESNYFLMVGEKAVSYTHLRAHET